MATALRAPGPTRRASVQAKGLPRRAGLRLKPMHFGQIVETWPDLGFFEIHAENYLVEGGPFHHFCP